MDTYGFPGKEGDTESGIDYLVARYYREMKQIKTKAYQLTRNAESSDNDEK